MTEYIDKIELMRRFEPFGREIPKDQVMSVIARVPAADRPKGEWIEEDEYGDLWVCDQCGCANVYKDNFCPDCGADMRGENK